jgi:hypothetical protein
MSRTTEHTSAVAGRPYPDDPATEAWIERHLAEAPTLTDRQRTALTELLRPVRLTGGEI